MTLIRVCNVYVGVCCLMNVVLLSLFYTYQFKMNVKYNSARLKCKF